MEIRRIVKENQKPSEGWIQMPDLMLKYRDAHGVIWKCTKRVNHTADADRSRTYWQAKGQEGIAISDAEWMRGKRPTSTKTQQQQ